MPYIDIRDQKEGLVMIKTFQKKIWEVKLQQIKGDQMDRVAQGRVGHPPDGVLKQMVSDNTPQKYAQWY